MDKLKVRLYWSAFYEGWMVQYKLDDEWLCSLRFDSWHEAHSFCCISYKTFRRVSRSHSLENLRQVILLVKNGYDDE